MSRERYDVGDGMRRYIRFNTIVVLVGIGIFIFGMVHSCTVGA